MWKCRALLMFKQVVNIVTSERVKILKDQW